MFLLFKLTPLKKTSFTSYSCEGTISLTHGPNVAAQREGLKFTVNELSVMANLANVDLHASVVLGCDQAVGGRAEDREELELCKGGAYANG